MQSVQKAIKLPAYTFFLGRTLMIPADVYLGYDINSLNPIHSWMPLLTPNPVGSTLLFLQLQSSVTGQ